MTVPPIFFALLLLGTFASHAATPPGPAAHSASKAAMVGTKIAARQNPHPSLEPACVASLRDDALAAPIQTMFERNLSAADLKQADAFFASGAGKVTTETGVDMLYANLAPEIPHTPSREPTAAEQAAAESFMASAAGRAVAKLMSDQSPIKPTLIASMHEVLAICAARGR